MRNYYPGITLFKLAGSILVVAFHLIFVRYTNDILSMGLGSLSFLSRLVVPCFFAVSGFLVCSGWRRAEDPWAYVRKYVIRIMAVYLVLYLGYVLTHTIPTLIREGHRLHVWYEQGRTLIRVLLLNGPFYQLWFIPPLIFGIIASYFLLSRYSLKVAWAVGLTGFVSSQFLAGTLWALIWPGDTYLSSLELLLARYFGFGLMFVLAGATFARQQGKLAKIKVWPWLAVSLVLTLVEGLLLHEVIRHNSLIRLSFTVLPNALLLFYGILRIRNRWAEAWHPWINLFSAVAFFGHVPLLKLNETMTGWASQAGPIVMDIGMFVLTVAECAAITVIWKRVAERLADRQRAIRSTYVGR